MAQCTFLEMQELQEAISSSSSSQIWQGWHAPLTHTHKGLEDGDLTTIVMLGLSWTMRRHADSLLLLKEPNLTRPSIGY